MFMNRMYLKSLIAKLIPLSGENFQNSPCILIPSSLS